MNIDKALDIGRKAGHFFDIDCFNHVLDIVGMPLAEIEELYRDAQAHHYNKAVCGHFVPDKDDPTKRCHNCPEPPPPPAPAPSPDWLIGPLHAPPKALSPDELQRMLDRAKADYLLEMRQRGYIR